MPADPAFVTWMKNSVTLTATTGRDSFGKPTAGATSIIKGRLVYETDEVRTADGQVVTSNAKLFVLGDAGLATTDRLTLPDGTSPPIIRIDRQEDERGSIHHTVVYF